MRFTISPLFAIKTFLTNGKTSCPEFEQKKTVHKYFTGDSKFMQVFSENRIKIQQSKQQCQIQNRTEQSTGLLSYLGAFPAFHAGNRAFRGSAIAPFPALRFRERFAPLQSLAHPRASSKIAQQFCD
jgi:hypothetical protein